LELAGRARGRGRKGKAPGKGVRCVLVSADATWRTPHLKLMLSAVLINDAPS
jgi:hypothetical protein